MKGYKPKIKNSEKIYINDKCYVPIIVAKNTYVPAFSTSTAMWSEVSHVQIPKNNKPTK